jgi:High potential iron-sulfur protein
VLDATRMFDNVQTLRVGMDMLIIGLVPLIALRLEVIAKRAMNMDRVITRRALVKGGLIAGALVPVAGLFISGAAYADLPALDPSDPAARGRDYVTKSAKSDAYCGNCSLYKKTGDSTGSCVLFAGKSVAFAGWCSGWVKIGAL